MKYDAPGPNALPPGARIESKGNGYLRVVGLVDHPLASQTGQAPLHRWVLYEALNRPTASQCRWCNYTLPWKTSLNRAFLHVVCVDHLDGDRTNNDVANLDTACWWCNANRSWAEDHPSFWSDWRKKMADVPPSARPSLPTIAYSLGLISTTQIKGRA